MKDQNPPSGTRRSTKLRLRLTHIVRRLIQAALVTGLLALILPRLYVILEARQHTYSIRNAPASPVAVIFGAGLRRDGTPTLVLRDRIAAGVELYQTGKVERLLMSGSSFHQGRYDEPSAMQAYAVSLGVPAEAILLDHAGFRTYNTCLNARDVFGLKQVTLVTQGFHLPRALYICNRLGLEASGVTADLSTYRRSARLIWSLRELPATLSAFLEINFLHPLPALDVPESIPLPES